MASIAPSSGLRHSYSILDSWLPTLHSLATETPKTVPIPEAILVRARELQTRSHTFAITAYVGQRMPPVIDRCLTTIKKITQTLLNKPIPDAELRSADLALRLITPLTIALDSLPSLDPTTPKMSESEHETKIAALRAHQAKFLENISRTDIYSSDIIKALTEHVHFIVNDVEIESLKAIRRSLIAEYFRTISQGLSELEAFVIANNLSDPAFVEAVLNSYKVIDDLCYELDVEAKDLGDDVLRDYTAILSQRNSLKAAIFEKYFTSTQSLLSQLREISYAKDGEAILKALSLIKKLIAFAATFEDRCRELFGAYEGPSEIRDLSAKLRICRADLFSGKLECDLTIMEKVQRDFPTLAGLPVERQESMISILGTFKNEFRQLQRCGIESGGLPEKVRERLSKIRDRHSSLRAWLDNAGIPDEHKATANMLKERFNSLASSSQE